MARINSGRTVAIGVLLTLVLLHSCGGERDANTGASLDPGDMDAPAIAVEAMTVETGRLISSVRGGGLAEGVREAWVVSETEGLVEYVGFKLGDRVSAGDVLLSVDDRLALSNRDLARQQYQTALLEYQAAEKAREGGSMSALQFSQVADRLLAAETARISADDAYKNTSLRAPFGGVVASRDRSLGIGTLLTRGIRAARIVDDSSFRTEISVGEGQVLLIREGASAEVKGSDGRIREGQVSAVSAGSDAGTGSYIVVVEWNPSPDDTLRSGMAVEVAIETVGAPEHLIIPASAIRLRAGEQYVFVAEDGIAVDRLITTGSRLGERVEVLSGLQSGETLITSGLASVTSGISVNPTLVGGSGVVR